MQHQLIPDDLTRPDCTFHKYA